MTTEQMKAELEAEGYKIYHGVDGDNSPYEYWRIESPDEWEYQTDFRQHRGGWLSFQHDPNLEKEAIEKAYVHLQQQRKLNALEAFVLARRTSDPIADDIVNEYNITADDEGDDDESI